MLFNYLKRYFAVHNKEFITFINNLKTNHMLNRAQLIGNIGGDPEVKQITNGKVANFSVATNESYKDKEGNKQEKTEWHRIVCFGNVAEIVEKYLSKGKRVFIEGKIQTREWEDKSGTKKYTTEIVAQTVRMLDRAKDTNGGTETPPAANATPKKDSKVQNSNQSKPDKPSAAAQPVLSSGDDDDNDLPF